jgi:formate C-acetyltransferase
MTDKVSRMLEFLLKREFRKARNEVEMDVSSTALGKGRYEKEFLLYETLLNNEKPCIYEDDIYGFNRTVSNYASYKLSETETSPIWCGGNITVDYEYAISNGFLYILDYAKKKKLEAAGESICFNESVIKYIQSTIDFCDRYRADAEQQGNMKLAKALYNVPGNKADSFYEALLFMKIIIFSLRCARNIHITLGRFDQYLYPYYLKDLEKGIPEETLFEELELFFISLNMDTDLYHGMQQGDNGQSLVLGGLDKSGNDMYNRLSHMIMEASIELCLIDPKINLRVSRKTPIEMYEYATKLTKKGLGFPQYCNDDIVVPGLCELGYDYEDALNYTVAACWEFIIPNKGADIPNRAKFNFPLVINDVIKEHLYSCDTFSDLLDRVKEAIAKESENIINECSNSNFQFSPFLSIYVDGCMEKGMDISDNAAKYNYSGCHGAGIANAADALAAVKKTIYDDRSIDKQTLLEALDKNYEGYEKVRNMLAACPKMGNNDDYADDIAIEIMKAFSSSMNGKPNGRGGYWRAGTGSAMFYVISAAKCPATADGRYAFEAYGSSYSPSLSVKLNGPLSVIQSFTKYDLKKIINGGPLTMEIHDTVFRNQEGEKKVAMLVKAFIELGGHQLQLNSINRERLIEAQKHPENYANLIVRVWGWSGYFCELDKKYQDHIIKRTEFFQ